MNLNNSSLGKVSDSNENENWQWDNSNHGNFMCKEWRRSGKRRTAKAEINSVLLVLAAKSPLKCHLNSHFQLYLFSAVTVGYCACFCLFLSSFLFGWCAIRCVFFRLSVWCFHCVVVVVRFFSPISPWQTNIHYHVNLLLFRQRTPVRCHGYKMQILIIFFLNLST